MLAAVQPAEHPRVSRELNDDFWGRGAAMLAAARKLQVPVLVVEGADDPRPNAAADSLVEALPNVERVTLKGAGHFPWLERRDDFAGVVRGWLGRVTGSS